MCSTLFHQKGGMGLFFSWFLFYPADLRPSFSPSPPFCYFQLIILFSRSHQGPVLSFDEYIKRLTAVSEAKFYFISTLANKGFTTLSGICMIHSAEKVVIVHIQLSL